jgi:hypothetical protein
MNDRAKKAKNTGKAKARATGTEKAKSAGAASEKAKASATEKIPKKVILDTAKRVLPVAATPAMQYWLKRFQLIPLTAWGPNAVDSLLIVTYIIAAASAAAASFYGAPSNKKKAWIVIIAGLVFITSYSTYTFGISQRPPTRVTHLFYYPVAWVSFFATYMSYGVLVAYVAKFLTDK